MSDDRYQFTTPASVVEAHARILELQARIGEIQIQLSDRNRTAGVTGPRLKAPQYHAWRRGAVSALHRKHVELRSLRAWLRERATPKPRKTLVGLVLALGRVEVAGEPGALVALRQALEGARQELGL